MLLLVHQDVSPRTALLKCFIIIYHHSSSFTHTMHACCHRLPHYDCVPFDISGDLYLKIFLWVKHGSGADCICRIVVDFKPDGTSRAGMKVRAQQLLDQGIRLVYHDHVNFEIQGVRSVKQGRGDFAAREIRFTRTSEVR